MRRTNIYLDDRQLQVLRHLGEQRSVAVSELIREAVDAWLAAQGVRVIQEGEWQRRFAGLLERRRDAAARVQPPADQVERDVSAAVAAVRRAASARRR
jgi:Ribbon-helix-helix domain